MGFLLTTVQVLELSCVILQAIGFGVLCLDHRVIPAPAREVYVVLTPLSFYYLGFSRFWFLLNNVGLNVLILAGVVALIALGLFNLEYIILRSIVLFERLRRDAIGLKQFLTKMIQLEFTHPLGRLSIQRGKNKSLCQVCYFEKNSNLFCNPCVVRDHEICIDCFATFMKTEMNFPEGSFFSCPFATDECSCLSTADLQFIQNQFRLDYFQRRFFKASAEEVIAKFEDAVLKSVVMKLHEMDDTVACPNQECKNRVVMAISDQNEAVSFEEEMLDRENRVEIEPQKKPSAGFLGFNIGATLAKKLVTKVVGSQDDGEKFDLRTFKCPDCHQKSCIVCKKKWSLGGSTHFGKSCLVYSGEHEKELGEIEREKRLTLTFLQMMQQTRQTQACPGCGEIIEKNGGCLVMNCTKCRTIFNWSGAGNQNFVL